MNYPRKIVLHCSASDLKEDDNLFKLRLLHTGSKEVTTDWGVYKYINCFGWHDIGYHYFITKDGSVHDCRPLNKVPAAVRGSNQDTIQICLSGDENFEAVQFRTLARVIKNLKEAFPIADKSIHGHNEYNPKKKCPNFSVEDFINDYME